MNIRHDFPFLERYAYFNSASCSPCPSPVARAMVEFYEQSPINYRSGTTPAEQRVTDRVDDVRRKLAALLGAPSAREVVFTKNTTEAINMVARGLKWQPGDEVILTPIEHQSNVVPWIAASEDFGVELKYVDPDPRGYVDPESVRSALTSKTKLVSIHHVSNVLGVKQDIEGIVGVAHEQDVLVLVDAAQSEGRCSVDVSRIGCDFLASCARKALMGPQGVGFLWGRSEHLRELRPLIVGSQAEITTGRGSYDYEDIPYRHEAGILNTAGVIGLGAALEYIDAISVQGVESYVRDLSEHLISVLRDFPAIETYGSPDTPEAGIVSWNVSGIDPSVVAKELYEREGVIVSAGSCGSPLAIDFLGIPGLVRTSVHCFNDESDIEKLGDGLKKIA